MSNITSLEIFISLPETIKTLKAMTSLDEYGAQIAYLDWLGNQEFNMDISRPIKHFHRSVDRFNKSLIYNEKFIENTINGDEYFELKKPETNRIVAVLPNTDKSDTKFWKLSHYDESGPIYHEVFKSQYEAVKCAIKAGFTTRCDGLLDELSDTYIWEKNTLITYMLYNSLSPHDELERAKTGNGTADGNRLAELVALTA